jgi:L-arabinokinase
MTLFFSEQTPVWSARAPGRLDVMGGIADYSGALVLQLPLDRATTAYVQRQLARRIDVVSQRGDQYSSFSIALDDMAKDPRALGGWFAAREKDRWAAYVVGIVQWCLQRSGMQDGVRVWLESTVPEGKGVSSSAAIEVATMMAMTKLCGLMLTAEEVATASQWVENHVVGAPCGIMDQMTSACGRRDWLLRLRCQPAKIEGHAAIPSGYRFYGIDSGVRHAVTGADYGTVRTAAFMGYRMIADLAGLPVRVDGDRVAVEDPKWNGYLANIPVSEFNDRFASQLPETMAGAEFLARFHGTTDRATRVDPNRSYPVRQSTAHPVNEQARVDRFALLLSRLALEPSVAIELGQLMYAAHASYSACGLGSEATDRLVEMVRAETPKRGLFGAKITGGGSGGTVAILGTVDAETRVHEIAARYASETGRVADVFTESGPGAAEFGIQQHRGDSPGLLRFRR